MKKAGMLGPKTDPAELAKRAFAHLDGVTDEWIEKTEVQKVAGGQTLPKEVGPVVAKADPKTGSKSCCTMPVIN